jgi:hypothetical protein
MVLWEQLVTASIMICGSCGTVKEHDTAVNRIHPATTGSCKAGAACNCLDTPFCQACQAGCM